MDVQGFPTEPLKQIQALLCYARGVDGLNNTTINKGKVLENGLHKDQQQVDVIPN